MSKPDESRYLSAEEIERKIGALTRADCVRIERLGQVYSWGTSWTSADLLQEAILAALQVRQWRADLTATVFLVGAMRSIAHSKRKSAQTAPLDRAMRASGEKASLDLERVIGDEDLAHQLAEAEAAAVVLNELMVFFKDDPQVQRVIDGRIAGENAAQTKIALGLDQNQYETVCRRLLRGYQKCIKVK